MMDDFDEKTGYRISRLALAVHQHSTEEIFSLFLPQAAARPRPETSLD